VLAGDSVLVVAAMFWGQSPMEWYANSEAEAVEHCKHVAEIGIEEKEDVPLGEFP
jgi:hypothetical protein